MDRSHQWRDKDTYLEGAEDHGGQGGRDSKLRLHSVEVSAGERRGDMFQMKLSRLGGCGDDGSCLGGGGAAL